MLPGGGSAARENLLPRRAHGIAQLLVVVFVGERGILVEPLGRQQLGGGALGFAPVLGPDAAAHEGLRRLGERDHAEAERHAQLHVALEKLERSDSQLDGLRVAFHDLTSSLHFRRIPITGPEMAAPERRFLQAVNYYIPSIL